MVRRASIVSLLATLAACGGGGDDTAGADGGADAAIDAAPPPDAGPDLTGPLFAPDHIVDVSITMAPADWDALRVQTRSIRDMIEGDCLAQPFPSPFTTFSAAVTIDGTHLDQVGIHKKGLLGSLNTDKPSLKLDMNEFVTSQRYLGLEKLTLNNANQDPAYVRQCLAYQLFRAAGLPASRCNFARVRMNGVELGIYVNVESVDHEFTRRHFTGGDGALYEGTLSDFRPGWTGTFDPKGGGDRTDLQPIVEALALTDDAALEAALAAAIDRDQFDTYWAMEVITGQWDGYAANRNNYFVYQDLATGRHVFLPWGVDGTFQPDHPFGDPQTGPNAVAAASALPHRLYATAGGRARFLARERALLASVWNETALLAEIDRMAALIGPVADATDPGWRTSLADVRRFVTGRRALLTAELDAPRDWPDPLEGYPCLAVAGTTTATFHTTNGTVGAANPLGTGGGTLAITVGATRYDTTPVGATAGLDPNPQPGQPPSQLVQLFGRRASDGHILVLVMAWPQAWFVPWTFDIGFGGVFGVGFDYDPVANSAAEIGFMLGTATLTQASLAAGAPVAGSVDAHLDLPGMMPLAARAAAAHVDLVRLNGTVRDEARALTQRTSR